MNKLSKHILIKNIDDIAQYDFANHKVFGSAYFVFQNNHLQVERLYGKFSPTSDKCVDGNTLFRLASMTKPVTAFAALILCSRGLLSLDDPIEKFLPDFKNISIIDSEGHITAVSKKPTIRNILSHTSGIESDPIQADKMGEQDKKSLDAAIAYYIKSGLAFEPGSKQQYSGVGAFDVLARIIEIVSRMDYLDFLKKEIFTPCDMPNTTFVPNTAQYEQLIDMHIREDDKNAVCHMPDGCIFEDFPCTHYLGGAGLVSTLHDYCNFAKMLLNKGVVNGNPLVDKKTFQQICTPQVSKDIMPGSEQWGLGVRVITEDTYPYLPKDSFGWSGAYGTHFWIDPSNEIFAVFMKNSYTDGGAGNESAVNFEKAVYSSFEPT